MSKSKKKCRQYDPSYIQYGFISSKNNPLLPQCLSCLMISNPESVLKSIPLSNNTISSRIADMADDVKSMLIQDLRDSKFSLTVDESTFANQSVLLAFVRYFKDVKICEELLFMKTLINTTGEHVCNAVTDFFKTNDISIHNMISVCTDGAPSLIGKRKGFVPRLIEDRNVFTIHCILHRENLVANNSGNRNLIVILQTVVSAVNKVRSQALQDRLFQDACREENFHRLVILQTYVGFPWVTVSPGLSYCLIKFWNFCETETLL